MIPADRITGLVLAGGEGRRMGGVDKGLLRLHGRPLVAHAVARLAPQVGTVAINANRHFEAYAALGAAAVWADDRIDGAEARPGPLAGLWTGLSRAATPYVATVPCDAPHFPLDLVARLVAALEAADARLAIVVAAHGEVWRPEPVFCLAHRSLADGLQAFIAAGGRKAGEWARQAGAARAHIADAGAFANLNTPEELAALEGAGRIDVD